MCIRDSRCAGDAVDCRLMRQAEFQLREDMFTVVELLRRQYPEFRDCSIVASGVNAGVRESRHIEGMELVTGQMLMAGEKCICPVARCAHPMDIHDAKSSEQTLRQLQHAAYVPFTALIPQTISNLLAAGRCICADRDAYASIRVQATLMSIGEAAGIMAALHCQTGDPVQDVYKRQYQESSMRRHP